MALPLNSILLTVSFLFQGCSEDEDSDLTMKELLAGTHSKSWMIERYAAYGISKKPDDCNTDDEFVFIRSSQLK